MLATEEACSLIAFPHTLPNNCPPSALPSQGQLRLKLPELPRILNLRKIFALLALE